MKIAIDIMPLTRNKRTGIENYIFNLCRNFPLTYLHNNKHRNNDYFLFANSYNHYQTLKLAIEEMGVSNYQNMTTKISRIPNTILKPMWNLPMGTLLVEYLIGEIDIFHASDRMPPPLKKQTKLVVTVFDLIPMKLRKFFTDKTVQGFTEYFKKVIPKADMVIAISNSTKNDILEYFDIAEECIQVTPLAANDNYKQILDEIAINKTKENYKINKDYILFCGTIEPRKNLVNLIRAYNILPEYIKNNYELVLCGKKGWLYEEIFNTVRELKLENKVIFTGYVNEKDIVLLMNGAAVFVYPSFYEGFGLPPLEAMACGTPVISSNVSSIPEVVGDAGILINPNDIEELSDAILKVLSNDELKVSLSEKGLCQASKFSWITTTEKTVEIYEKVGS